MYFDPEQVIPNRRLSLREGAILPWATRTGFYYQQVLEALAEFYAFDIRTPFA
jgi:excinuclease ABC subunit A